MAKVRKEFPICEHAQRLDLIAPPQLDLINYMPRTWFINKEKNMLIQVQDDIFYFNWRRIKQDEPNPRYNIILKKFKDNLKKSKQFLQDEGLGEVRPKRCELTYNNQIPMGDGWKSLSDIGKIFRDLSWSSRKRFLPLPNRLGWQGHFSLPENLGRLDATITHAERRVDKHPLLVLQLSAKGLGEDKSFGAAWKWFSVAHEWIVRGFADLTEAAVQKDVWRRTDGK
ncbi:MAG: TIGR04255 family protein [Desulfobacterales bacterium]|nr:TIGR04255 family protein [Desulfobacterales bacterium]